MTPPAPTASTLLPHPARQREPITRRWPRMSYEEYLVHPDVPECSEWVDGEVSIMSVNRPQSMLTLWLGRLLGNLVEQHDLGEVHLDPFNMKTGPHLPGRAPDVLYVATANLHRLRETHLEGPGDIVIEVVSEDSRRRDRVTKLAEYEAGGVPEYWWLDQDREEAGFFHRGNDGKYQRVFPDDDGIYRCRVLPQLRLEVASLWRDPLPKVRDVLRGWEEG